MSKINNIIAELNRLKVCISNNNSQHTDRNRYMRSLWDLLSAEDDERLAEDIVTHSDFPELYQFYSRIWGQYISSSERIHSISISSGKETPASVLAIEDYDELVNEIDLVKISPTDRIFVMVGSGPFPETLMKVYDLKNSFPTVIGVDRCHDSLELAQRIFFSCVQEKVYKKAIFINADGAEYNYEGASVILLANGLKNKRGIIARASQTMADNAVILARNPIRLGRMLYEDILNPIVIDGFKITGYVEPSRLSRTYVLQRDTL